MASTKKPSLRQRSSASRRARKWCSRTRPLQERPVKCSNLAADSSFTVDPETKALVVGTGSVAYQGSRAIGSHSSATGPQSTAIGYANTTRNTYGVAIGAYNTTSGAASVAIGELLKVSGDNAVALGYSTEASGVYSVALGVANGATSTGSFACGMRSWATRPGEFVHSSGTHANSGLHAIDLAGKADGGSIALTDVEGNELHLATAAVSSLRIRLTGVSVGDHTAKRAHEVHELLVTSRYAATVDSDERIAGDLAAQGWSVSISGDRGNVLHVVCDGGTSASRFFARVEWSEMGNVEL